VKRGSYLVTGILIFLIFAALKYWGLAFIGVIWIGIWLITGLASWQDEKRAARDRKENSN
jgi:hypothetical protein